MSSERQITVLGVHPVEADEPCHLIEVSIANCSDELDVGGFTQCSPGQPKSYWQVAWDERYLNPTGEEEVADFMSVRPEMLMGSVRLAFFLHYVSFERPLITPYGEVELPEPTPMPGRLEFI